MSQAIFSPLRVAGGTPTADSAPCSGDQQAPKLAAKLGDRHQPGALVRECPLCQPERRASPPGGRAANAAGWLEEPTRPSGALGGGRGGRRGQPPSADGVPDGLQQVAQREAVSPDLDVGEAAAGQESLQRLRLVTPEVA